MMTSRSSSTDGVRTWQRTGADAASSLDERIVETTDPTAMTVAIAEADFVTIPRSAGAGASGYDDAYARAFGAALAERFGYADARRVSASGRSHVFERTGLSLGATVDLGISVSSTLAEAPAASQSPLAVDLAGDLSGDGASRRPPTLAVG